MPREGIVLNDFPGLVTNADPRDLPPGGAQILVNLSPRMSGNLQSRKGFKTLSFESQVTVGVGPLQGGFAIFVAGSDASYVPLDYLTVDVSVLDNLARGMYDATNADAVTLVPGMACAVDATSTSVVRAYASDPTLPVIGLAYESIAPSAEGKVQTEGLFTLSDWSAVTDAASAALSPKAVYYLSGTNRGKLTTTAPTGTGKLSQQVGVAVSSTTLALLPMMAVLL